MKEYNVAADKLIEAIKQNHKRATGEDITKKELVKIIAEVMKERLND